MRLRPKTVDSVALAGFCKFCKNDCRHLSFSAPPLKYTLSPSAQNRAAFNIVQNTKCTFSQMIYAAFCVSLEGKAEQYRNPSETLKIFTFGISQKKCSYFYNLSKVIWCLPLPINWPMSFLPPISIFLFGHLLLIPGDRHHSSGLHHQPVKSWSKVCQKKSLQLQYDMITWFDWTIRIFRKNFKNPSFNFLCIICQHEGAEYWYTGEVLKNSKVEKQMIMISTFGENIEKSRKENIEKQKSFEIFFKKWQWFYHVSNIYCCG